MSDGPHRSLDLRKQWKKLAEVGDNQAYANVEVAQAAATALASDFINEVSWKLINMLKSIFSCSDNSLGSPEIALQQLNDARALAGGSVFGQNAVSCSEVLVAEGRLELQAFYDAIGLAAKMRGLANAKAVEEHYLRQSTVRRANNVAGRIKSAVVSFSESKLGSLLIDARSAITRSPKRKNKSGLDDGVEFS